MFEDQASVWRQILRHHDQSAVVIHAKRYNFKRSRLPVQCHKYIGPHAEQHALTAAPIRRINRALHGGGSRSGFGRRTT